MIKVAIEKDVRMEKMLIFFPVIYPIQDRKSYLLSILIFIYICMFFSIIFIFSSILRTSNVTQNWHLGILKVNRSYQEEILQTNS